jgi:hypothetical protein
MRDFEGTVRVRFHPEKRVVFLDRGTKGSTLTAADAEKILALAIVAAEERKVGFDRWTFYIPGVNQKLARDDQALPLKDVVEALKAGKKPKVRLGNYAKPQIVIGDESGPLKRESKIVDIA